MSSDDQIEFQAHGNQVISVAFACPAVVFAENMQEGLASRHMLN